MRPRRQSGAGWLPGRDGVPLQLAARNEAGTVREGEVPRQ